MNRPYSKQKILFITSMPASHTNAIGIQTLHYADALAAEWHHCYWDYGMGMSEVQNSYCLNSAIPRLWPFAAGRGFLFRQVERFRIGWWRGDRLIQSRKHRLRALFKETGFAHVAPLGNAEATRCREILEVLDCPFVMHLWDLLDSPLNADYAWLLLRAEHVFCLSETMIRDIGAVAKCEASILAFVRPQSRYLAEYSGSDTVVIGLVGFLTSYQDGLHLLSTAVERLRKSGVKVRIRYIGLPGQLRYIPEHLIGLTEYLGFADDDQRDKALAGCSFGYLPGPLLPPEQDLRSRYSIPSRSADYMAVGLPVVAAANAFSATSRFLAPIRNHGFFQVSEPSDFCVITERLREESMWKESSQGCRSFFELHFNKQFALTELRSIAQRFL